MDSRKYRFSVLKKRTLNVNRALDSTERGESSRIPVPPLNVGSSKLSVERSLPLPPSASFVSCPLSFVPPIVPIERWKFKVERWTFSSSLPQDQTGSSQEEVA